MKKLYFLLIYFFDHKFTLFGKTVIITRVVDGGASDGLDHLVHQAKSD